MKKISEYTEAEFIRFVETIRAVNKSGSDKELGRLLAQFRALTCHPTGTDLIFYPEADADDSPEGVTQIVKDWREKQGLPGFKDS